jgi:hypothetical protein
MIVKKPGFPDGSIYTGFLPNDPETKKVYKEVEAFARHGKSIMIFGPTGAGKEFLARHYYQTLTESDLYKRWKRDWPTNYENLYNKYDDHYSPGERDIFINSLVVGDFTSLNGSTIIPTLAESLLFGHEKGIFNEAVTNPGLLEVIKYGVLFIDEIGDLPREVQPKLLRALDPQIRTAHRIGSKMKYSLKDMIIISATNQPRETIRDDLYFRVGEVINIKGLDERPADFRNFIPGFICDAIGQRTDCENIKRLFNIKETVRDEDISQTQQVKDFANKQAKELTRFVEKRKWPGSLRALNRVFESAVVTTVPIDDIENFTDSFIEQFHIYLERNSVDSDASTTHHMVQQAKPVFPSKHPRLDKRIFDEITGKKLIPTMNDTEINILSKFLSSSYGSAFVLKDLIAELKKYPDIKHTSEGRIRDCLNKLSPNILEISGRGKGTRYRLTELLPSTVYSEDADIFALPNFKPKWTSRNKEIKELNQILYSERIYIEAPARHGKTAFITMFCHAMQKQYNFYYYRLGSDGLMKLFQDIRSSIKISDPPPQPGEPLSKEVAAIQPHLSALFKKKGNHKPVLILDDVHYVSDANDFAVITTMAEKWTDVILILLGGKKDIIFNQVFTTLLIPEWRKHGS